MSASQPAIFNLQEFTDAGLPLLGGRLYTYGYGTTAQKVAYTDPDGTVPHTYTADGTGGQYIALNARGELPAPLYLADGSYDIVLKRADGSAVWTRKADGVGSGLSSWIANIASSTGASLVGFIQSALGAVKRTVLDKLFDIVSVKDFGAKGDGAADDTAAIQAALDHAAAYGKGVYTPAGTYKTTSLRIKNGCRSFWTDSATLVGTSGAPEGIITFDGVFYGTAGVTRCRVYGFKLDGGGVAKRGIFAATAQDCEIFGNFITNLSAVNGDSGINIHFGSVRNKIYANNLYMSASVAAGIYCISQTVDQYAGWMNGAIQQPTNVAAYNTISDNYINGGTHGISLFGGQYNTVEGNICDTNTQRGIILSPVACYNIVQGNQCLFFGSSGIHMAYGSNSNVVNGNRCYAPGSNGEAGIQAYVTCSGNKITDNLIHCASNFGVYFAIDATYNEASTNTITGNLQRAGIAIESDWTAALPALAIYSRPNYGAPQAPRVNWPNGSTFGNTIKGNIMLDLPAGVGAISVAQIGAVSTNQDNVIVDNVVNGTTPRHYLHLFEANANSSFGHVIERNKFKTNDPAKIYLTRGRPHFISCAGNSILNSPSFVDIATTTTPDVSVIECVSTAGYGAPTTILNFVNGIDGQRIVVRMSVNTTIQNNANIKLKGGVDASGANSNDYMTFQFMRGTVWAELSRTF